jgi:hypothetical protein
VPTSPSDARRGQAFGQRGFLPGAAEVGREGSGERSWVQAAKISQVQRSADSGVRIFGRVQPRGLLDEAKGVFDVEAAAKRSPEPVGVVGGGGVGARPASEWLRFAT